MHRYTKIALVGCTALGRSLLISQWAHAKPTQNSSPKISIQSSQTITRSRGRLGAQVIGISPALRKHFGAPTDQGLLVDRVLPDSPASRAGLRPGDVIISTNHIPSSQAWDITKSLEGSNEGDSVSVLVIRNGKRKLLSATLDDSAMPSALHWGAGGMSSMGNMGPGWDPTAFFRSPQQRAPFGLHRENQSEALNETIRRLQERLDALEGGNTKPRGPQKLRNRPQEGNPAHPPKEL